MYEAVEEAQGSSFQVYADGVQNGTEALPDERTSSANRRESVQGVRKSLTTGHGKDFFNHLPSSADIRAWLLTRSLNALYFALPTKKCFASNSLPVFHLLV